MTHNHHIDTRQADTRAQIKALIDSSNKLYSGAKIAKQMDISSATFSQWIGGTYPGNNDAIEAKAQAYLDNENDRLRNGGMPQGPEYIATPTAQKVIDGLRYAQQAPDIVIIYGGAGVSKSKGIEQHARTANNVWHVTMQPSTASVGGCLEEIGIALGLRDMGPSRRMHRMICNRLRGTGGLLAIDEAQHLGIQALDQIRGIYDATNVGLAIVGNEQVYARMTGNRAAFLDRLFSRIGKRIHLKRASTEDIDAFAAAWGIDDRDCRKVVQEIGGKPGALRVLSKVLRLAASYAQALNREICCEDVRASWRELGGME